jgi:hypothetical protein
MILVQIHNIKSAWNFHRCMHVNNISIIIDRPQNLIRSMWLQLVVGSNKESLLFNIHHHIVSFIENFGTPMLVCNNFVHSIGFFQLILHFLFNLHNVFSHMLRAYANSMSF